MVIQSSTNFMKTVISIKIAFPFAKIFKVIIAFVFYLNNRILNKLSEYIYFCISKNITSYAFLLVLKTAQAQVKNCFIS